MFIWLVINSLILVATLVPYSRVEHYLVRGWDFPRFQLWCGAVISILLQVLFVGVPSVGWWWVAGVVMLAGGIQSVWIFPYTRFSSTEVPTTDEVDAKTSLRVITANVLQTNRRVRDLLGMVRDESPDILVLLETDQWWCDQAEVLVAEGYQHTVVCPLDNLYGMAVFSKLELRDTATDFLISDEVPSMPMKVALRSGAVVDCHWVHPAPPSPTENTESTERDAELVLVGRRVSDSGDIPTVVAGDLNDVAWSATTRLFRKMSGLLDPRVGRGFYSSFHAKLPGLRWPLDHLFHSRHFTLNEIRCLGDFGSDHFPLLIELQLREDPMPKQQGLTASSDDHAWAEEKVATAERETKG